MSKLNKQLESMGGYLECQTCGAKQGLGNVGEKLLRGWPKCCGYTMRWITARELGEAK